MMAGIGAKVRDWFNGGDPQGHIKIRQWLRGYDDRPEGWTYGMMGPAMGLSVLAGLLYPLTRGDGRGGPKSPGDSSHRRGALPGRLRDEVRSAAWRVICDWVN